MADGTTIEWTHAPGYTGATLNPWTGCTKVSPGCANCYIARTPPFRIEGRSWDRKGHIPLVFHMGRLERMVARRKPTMYFVNSLSDLFHEDAHDEQIAQVFGAMAAAPQHVFQILTKRPERMRKLLGSAWLPVEAEAYVEGRFGGDHLRMLWPLPNVWLGVSIENRRFVGRADLLREAPAAVRFISAEPLLSGLPGVDLAGIDWVICGGESGPGHRPMRLEWARDLRDACEASGTAFFMKQMGGLRPGSKLGDLPEDLRIREYPQAKDLRLFA